MTDTRREEPWRTVVQRPAFHHGRVMDMLGPVADIAHNIQLAVAPVLLLTGVGSILSVLTARLGRVIDRARHIEAHFDEYHGEDHDIAERELLVLDRRLRVVHWAVGLCTSSALLVCAVIAVLFVGDIIRVDLSLTIAGIFIAAMVMMMAGLLLFLWEIQIATRSVRVRPSLLKKTAHRWG